MLTPIRKCGHPQVTNESFQGISNFPLVKYTMKENPQGKSDNRDWGTHMSHKEDGMFPLIIIVVE